MNATPLPRAPSLRRRASRAAGIVASLVVLLATATPRAVRAESEVEPLSPVIFFPEPDAEAREDIERVINTSFADVSKAVEAREILVKRFGLVSVPQLVARLESGSNEPEMWNAALAIGTLRRTYGPSHLLWPAIRPLTKVLKTASGDPWRRVFAALALGEFHGREGARRSPTSREGSEEGARLAGEALVEAEKALAAAMADARAVVGAAAALALGKSGGAGAGGLVLDYVRSVGAAAPPETRLASLLALGLLPGQERDEGGLGRALQDSDRRVRAKAALAIGCWAVAERAAFGPAAAGSQAATRAAAYEPLVV